MSSEKKSSKKPFIVGCLIFACLLIILIPVGFISCTTLLGGQISNTVSTINKVLYEAEKEFIQELVDTNKGFTAQEIIDKGLKSLKCNYTTKPEANKTEVFAVGDKKIVLVFYDTELKPIYKDEINLP